MEMSIISHAAEHVYKDNALLQEAYIAGATRLVSDEELETGAKQLLFDMTCRETMDMDLLLDGQDERIWREADEYKRNWVRGVVTAILGNIRRKAMEE